MKKMVIWLAVMIVMAYCAMAQSMQQRTWQKEHWQQLKEVDMAAVVSGAALGATALQPAGRLTGSMGSSTTAVDTVVSNAALGATAVQPAQVWGAAGITPSTNQLVNTVSIQAKTAAGGNLSERRLLRIWVSDTSLGSASTNNIASLVLSTGAAVETVITNADYRYVTSATGTVTATVTGTAVGTNYLMVADGSSVSAGTLVFTE